MNTKANLVRRRFLATGAGAVAVAGIGRGTGVFAADAAAPAEAKLPPYVSWKDPRSMIVHTSSTLETRRTAFGRSIHAPPVPGSRPMRREADEEAERRKRRRPQSR